MPTTKDVKRENGKLKYRGETFPGYNKPKKSSAKSSKFTVLAKKGDKVKKVNFGDPDMTIKKDQKDRKKSYCARSGGIKGKNDKFSANYWSRRAWSCK